MSLLLLLKSHHATVVLVTVTGMFDEPTPLQSSGYDEPSPAQSSGYDEPTPGGSMYDEPTPS